MNWESLDQLFLEIREQEYLIMRNYDFVMGNLIGGEDIDFLCEQRDAFAQRIGAFPVKEGEDVFNYWVIIDGIKIRADIREIGDGYYDSAWERAMLNKKCWYKNFYIMDKKDYAYSLLYHSLIHKPAIAPKYEVSLSDYFGVHVGQNEETDQLLCNYMCKEGYCFVKPVDKEVDFNHDNFYRLNKIYDSILCNNEVGM